jgi:2'-5' RNA ligase
MENIRAFIAIDIGDEIREHLDQLQRKLKKVHANVRWVKPRNIHLTLAFLGNLPAEKVPALQDELDRVLRNVKPFDIKAEGTGFFGRPRHPRVIWAGILDCPALMKLQQKTVEALQAAEIEFDSKPFSPHLTLGRVKAPNHTESLLGKLDKYKDYELGQTRIETVEIIQSELLPHGAEYSVLHRVALLKAP